MYSIAKLKNGQWKGFCLLCEEKIVHNKYSVVCEYMKKHKCNNNNDTLKKVWENARLDRYSQKELRIEVDCIYGLNEIDVEHKLNSIMIIHIPTNINVVVVGEKPLLELLSEALDKLYKKMENAFKVDEEELTLRVENFTVEVWEHLIEKWYNGELGVGHTLRETLGLNKENYERLVKEIL